VAKGHQDARIVRTVQGLFSVRGGIDNGYELANVMILCLRGSRRPHIQERILHMEFMDVQLGFHFIRIADICYGSCKRPPLERGNQLPTVS